MDNGRLHDSGPARVAPFIRKLHECVGLTRARRRRARHARTLTPTHGSLSARASRPARLAVYRFLCTPTFEHIVTWTESGDTFVVRVPHVFARELLPLLYHHHNFGSFVRQLNKYDFRKVRCCARWISVARSTGARLCCAQSSGLVAALCVCVRAHGDRGLHMCAQVRVPRGATSMYGPEAIEFRHPYFTRDPRNLVRVRRKMIRQVPTGAMARAPAPPSAARPPSARVFHRRQNGEDRAVRC